MRSTSTAGWTKATVPNVWNLGDELERVDGRRDRLVPQGLRAADADAALEWAVRFESVNYRTRVWLNGRPIGENTGAYIPFELRLERPQAPRRQPARGARRLAPARPDFPPSRPEHRRRADRRLVELLRHPARGLPAQARHGRLQAGPGPPGAACGTCAASVRVAVNLRNVTRAAAQRRHGHRQFGDRTLNLGHQGLGPGRDRGLHGHAPDRASRGCGRRRPEPLPRQHHRREGGRKVAGYKLHSGIRSIKVSHGRLCSTASSSTCAASACTRTPRPRASRSTTRAATSWSRGQGARRDGAAHALPAAPLHARAGRPARDADLVRDPRLLASRPRSSSSRRCARLAAKELRRNIEANQNHPSVLLWSIGNELSSQPGPVQGDYIAAAARSPRSSTRRGRSARGRRLPGARCQAEPTRRSTSSASTTTSAGTRARAARCSTARALRLPRRGPRLLPGQGAHGHGVRRRGQPRRPARGEGHVGASSRTSSTTTSACSRPSRG